MITEQEWVAMTREQRLRHINEWIEQVHKQHYDRVLVLAGIKGKAPEWHELTSDQRAQIRVANREAELRQKYMGEPIDD